MNQLREHDEQIICYQYGWWFHSSVLTTDDLWLTLSTLSLFSVFSSIPTLAKSTLPVALFFWSWALKNTMGYQKVMVQAEAKGKKANVPTLDLGVLSFLTSALSCTFLLGAGTAELSSSSRMLVTGSFAFVSINYALGCALYHKAKPKVAVYCGIFTGIWGLLAYNVNALMKAWI